MEKHFFFPYSWHIDEDEEEITLIRVYGLSENNENICVRIDNFTPYVYIELPTRINWDAGKAQLVGNKIDEILKDQKPLSKVLMTKKKLYGAHLTDDGNRQLFPYLFCSFSNRRDIKTLGYRLRRSMNILGLGVINLKIHESDADEILQLTCCRKIPTAGWIEFHGKRQDEDNKITLCDHEFKVKWKHLSPIASDKVAKPKILSFDIEVNSTNPATMPKSERPGDKVFQISCVMGRYGDKPEEYEKYLLSLGQPDPDIVGEDVLIYMYETEAALLEGFTEFIREENPNLIVGYNILGFDIPYMIDRAKFNMCIFNFDKQGFHKYAHARERTIKWSSSAYKNQEFQFLDAEGRVYVDLLPLVKRDFKFSNYKLKTISEYFVGETKDPLSVKGIFKCYRLGTKKNKNGEYNTVAQRAMGVVGKYCFCENTAVSGKHGNIPIQNLYGQNMNVLSWNEKTDNIEVSIQSNFFDNGQRECVELELEDGRTITCTPDHQLATKNGWTNADDIPIGDKIKVGPILPDVELDTTETVYARILGYMITDGHISKERCVAYCGNLLDAQMLAEDIETVFGYRQDIRKDRNCWMLILPKNIRAKINREEFIIGGNRTTSRETLPDVSSWSKPRIREFLAGMFGGDGWCPSWAKKDDKFTPIGLTQSRTNKEVIEQYMEQLSNMLKLFDIFPRVRITKRDNLYIGSLSLQIKDIERFVTTIGYRYCYHKTIRSSIAVIYYRIRNQTIERYQKFYEQVKNSDLSIAEAYRTFVNNYRYPPTYGTMKCWVSKGFPLGRPDQASRNFPKVSQFLFENNLENIFIGDTYHTYCVSKDSTVLPTFSLKLVSKKNVGVRQVYDITVENTHSLLANGIVAHNCVQDSALVLLLVDKLQTWVGLTEMAKTCNVPIFTLYTQGQQIKVYSQLYQYCMYENIVVEKDGYQVSDNERYVGAHVFPPVPGQYNHVVPFDFASLYPTTIIAYNIDYHTWVPDDSDIPDSKCHVMEWQDCIGCLVEGTKVTVGEYSMKIEDLEDYHCNLLAYNKEKQGMGYYQQTNFFNQGIKECLRLTMEDGTTLCCTPDHRILLSNNTWVEAKDIQVGQDRVSTSYSPPMFDIKDQELVCGNFHFTGSKLVKFYKILGVLCSDGYMCHNRTRVYLGHPIDVKNMVRDLEDLQEGCTSVRKENYGWGISILGELGKIFRNLNGVMWNAKVNQTRTLPALLEHATQGELCAFLSGLFGGDDHTLSYSEKAQYMGTIGFSWTSRQPEQLTTVFLQLQKYLRVCGIDTSSKRMKDETYLWIKNNDILKFKECIGFSYCVHKSMRLEAGYSYLKLRDEALKQQKWLVDRVKTLKNTMTIEEATTQAITELHTNLPVYNEYYASPSLSQMKDLLRPRKKWSKVMFLYKYFPTVPEYLESIGASKLFETYAVDINNEVLPRLYKKIIKVESIGKKQVYDLEVSTSHSFVADGVVVHNCAHDPKVIRKVELTKYIDKERDIIKKIREKRNKTVDKLRKKEIMNEINAKLDELKPYIRERSELNKTKPKFPMCSRRYYRFLKEPRGVLPTVIQNLLDARKHTRKVDMVAVKKKIDKLEQDMKENGADHSEEIENLNNLVNVLDKRQLAYKVSANSMYGAMGVRRGYLPFMPGAMCTTYMGRVNIELTAETIVNKFGGQLVYGDTDCLTGETPVLLKWTDPREPSRIELCYKTMETISAGNWTRINPNKEISDPLPGYQIWSDQGFTDIVNVVRCGVVKPLSRVVVHVGEVTCSNEHSLLREDLTSATPLDIKVKDPLCITELPLPDDTPLEPKYPNNLTDEVIQNYEIPIDTFYKDGFSAELAFIWGVFFADGSCGTYIQKGKYTISTWAINKRDKTLLERCMNILKRHETGMDFNILDTVKSSHVYKLVAIKHSRKLKNKGDIKNFVEKYRELFYDERKYKKVPNYILNLPLVFREAFFMGYYAGDGSKKDPALIISNKGAIGSAGLFFLMRSLGYKVSINTRNDKPDIYKLTGSSPKQNFRYKPNNVKKIIPVHQDDHQYIYDIETANHHFAAGVGQLVVHNSNYINFPNMEGKSDEELWEYSEHVADQVTKLFPPPMKLEFEGEIYTFFFILTKKRYMYRKVVQKDGKMIYSNNIGKKGVLLARRDNSKFVRDVYEGIINRIADNIQRDDILFWVLEQINLMFSTRKPHTDFIVTKAVGNTGRLQAEAFVNEKGEKKAKVGDYTTPILSSDKTEREEQLAKKGANNAQEFYLLCLPAQVQLAERMKIRGQRVDAGTRLEYVVTDPEKHTAKQYEKVESAEYYIKHSDIVKMDYYYYLKALANPLDQVLSVAFPEIPEFVLCQYNYRWKIRHKCLKELKDMFRVKLYFE
jgi:DNA polymerase elongation subunit (family B)